MAKMGKSHLSDSHLHQSHPAGSSIRARVFRQLQKSPSLTARPLCKRLGLSYEKHGDYVKHVRAAWRKIVTFEQGLKRPNWHGFVLVPEGLNREDALAAGWALSRCRNRALIWADPMGRLEWFETGRVKICLKKPANEGRLAQLLAMAFYRTGLLPDIQVFEDFRKSARAKGPRFLLAGEKPENGLVYLKDPKVPGPAFVFQLRPGDALPLFPDWHERNERAGQDLKKTLHKLKGHKKSEKSVRAREFGVV